MRPTYFCLMTSQMSWAAITKYHRVGGLNNRNLFSHSCGAWKPEIRVPKWSGSGESSLPGLENGQLMCSYMVEREGGSELFVVT